MEELIDSWHINNRVTLYLLEAIPEEHLGCMSHTKGRSVGGLFAHIHRTRLLWLRSNDRKIYAKQSHIEKAHELTKDILLDALPKSADGIAELVRKKEAAGKSVSGFKPHNAAFLSYLISHESHHRGQVMLVLKQSGHPVDKGVAYGLWEWGAR